MQQEINEGENNYTFNVEGGTKEMIIRHGTALEQKEIQPLEITGTITSPGEFYLKRKEQINPESSHVVYSKNNGIIALHIHEKSPIEDVITGALFINPDLLEFEINQGKQNPPKNLASFLKMNKFFFRDAHENMNIVTALNSLTARIETDLEAKQDNRGNDKKMVDKRVTSNVPLSFVLKMPIFVGQGDSTFRVEIGVDATESSIMVWLESQELNELMISKKDELMERELAIFRDDLVVIEQ